VRDLQPPGSPPWATNYFPISYLVSELAREVRCRGVPSASRCLAREAKVEPSRPGDLDLLCVLEGKAHQG